MMRWRGKRFITSIQWEYEEAYLLLNSEECRTEIWEGGGLTVIDKHGRHNYFYDQILDMTENMKTKARLATHGARV